MSEKKCYEKCAKKTVIGGQALIEGIYMRGPEKTATVIRRSDGTHTVRERAYTPAKKKFAPLGWPFIRGIFVFGSSIKDGVGELMFSAENSEFEETEPTKFDRWVEEKIGAQRAEKLLMGFSVVLGVLMPIALFILLPTLLSSLVDFGDRYWLRSLCEGVLRMAIFILFIFSTSRMKDMRRVYAFHGAEHKSIHCYEAGEELTVENVRRHTRKHPRCGTSFLFVVMIISIIFFSFVRTDLWFPAVTAGWAQTLIRLGSRIVLLPIVLNISYEFNRLVGRYDNFLTKALRWPGVAMQSMTTNEPTDEMIEVAIDALSRVIPENSEADKW